MKPHVCEKMWVLFSKYAHYSKSEGGPLRTKTPMSNICRKV